MSFYELYIVSFFIILWVIGIPLGILFTSISLYFDEKRFMLRKQRLEKFPPKKSRFKFVNWWRNR